MPVPIPYKSEKESIENSRENQETPLSFIKAYMNTQEQLTPKWKIISDLISNLSELLYMSSFFASLKTYLLNLRRNPGYTISSITSQWELLVVSILRKFWATAWDFQQFDILTSVDSDEPLQPPVKLRNSKWCSVSSLTIIEYSSD